jgi:hypothetical protein
VGAGGRLGYRSGEHRLHGGWNCGFTRAFQIGGAQRSGIFGDLFLGTPGGNAPGKLLDVVIGNGVLVFLLDQ